MDLLDKINYEREKLRGIFANAHLPEIFAEGEFRFEAFNFEGIESYVPIISLESFPLAIDCPIVFSSSRKITFAYPGTGIIFKTGAVGVGFRNPFLNFNDSNEALTRYSNENAKSEIASVKKELARGLDVVRQYCGIECRKNGNLYIAEEFGESLFEVAKRHAQYPDLHIIEGDRTFSALRRFSENISNSGADYVSPRQIFDDKEILHRLIRFDKPCGEYEIKITSNPYFKYDVSKAEARSSAMINHTLIRDAFDKVYSFEKERLGR